MTAVVPYPFMFRYSIAIPRIDDIPRARGKNLLALPESCRLPNLRAIENTDTHKVPDFADVRVGWNAGGIGVSVTVTGRTNQVECDKTRPTETDGLQVWIDTRDTKNIHRSGRFCRHFALLPFLGMKKSAKPFGVELEIARAKEKSTLASSKDIRVQSQRTKDGYLLEAWLSQKILHGFDSDSQQRLGFYYCVVDSELGTQFMTVNNDFPVANDPSLWATLEMASERK